MMYKKNILAVLFCLLTTHLMAQNIQFHYDLGSALYKELDTRPKLTTTVEMFKPDAWGSTFFFIDMAYAEGEVSMAYWEVTRELKFWKNPFSIHVEYNGGIRHIKNSYLGGITYTWNSKDFSNGFSFSAMYKYLHHNPEPNSFQLTSTWHLNFCKGKLSCNGYIDYSREIHVDMYGKEHKYVLMAEPQFWVNLNKFKGVNENFNLSLGTEWRISHNFALMDGFYLNPTLAMKWTF